MTTLDSVSDSGVNRRWTVNRQLPFVAACCCAIVTFSSAFVAIRAGLHAYSPLQLITLRLVISSLVFAALTIFRPVRLPTVRDLPRLIMTGVMGFAVYGLLINSGETRVSAGVASFVVNTTPVFTAILASMALRERMPAEGWIGLAVSLSGTALLAFGTGTGSVFEPAVMILIAAAVVQAIYFTMQKPLIGRYGAMSVISWAVWSGAACLLPMLPSTLRQVQRAPLGATLSVVYLAVVPTVIGYTCWAFAVSRVPVGRITALLYFVPPVATLIGWILLGERPTLLGICGGCVAIAGVAMVGVRRK